MLTGTVIGETCGGTTTGSEGREICSGWPQKTSVRSPYETSAARTLKIAAATDTQTPMQIPNDCGQFLSLRIDATSAELSCWFIQNYMLFHHADSMKRQPYEII